MFATHLRSEAFAAFAALISIQGCSSSDKGGAQSPVGGKDAGATCPSHYVDDGKKADRAACTFAAASLGKDTISLTPAEKKIPLEHIIVIMRENRSFDQLFGKLGAAQSDSEPIPPTFSNKDASGATVSPFHLTTTCVPTDPGHQWNEMHAQVNGGKMDGFVTSAASTATPGPSDGHFALGYYEESDLPFYYFLAKTYALADRHFPSVLSGTWANRDYLYAGTSDGVKNTLTDGIPGADVTLIFDAMTQANVSWGVYADNGPLSVALEWSLQHPGVHPVQDLIDGLSAGTLPNVVFADGKLNEEDEHPPADVQVGEAWTKSIYDALVASPLWEKTALLFTYDEAGGFFDHVPPPTSCVARPDNPKDTEFFELGVRVPLIAISPWARRHYVSHVQHEHTSITRLIELVFGVPALTKRDANSDALLDMFDFDCKNDDPVPLAPAAGTGGCRPPADAGSTPAP
jgi:phospholipase C